MTTVLLTGASGLLGRSLLARPAARAYRIRALSRRPHGDADGVQWCRADLDTGEGLDAAVAGADAIVHAASAPRGDTRRTDVDGTRALLAAAARAGVRHAIYVSIVGVDRVPVAYYRHKLAAEAAVAAGGVPWTVLRGTQFHELMDAIVRRLTRLPVALAPRGLLAQPVHVDDFADAVWDAVAHGPAGRAPDVGGPEVLSYVAMERAWLAARGERKPVLQIPVPGRAAAALRRGDGTSPGRAVGLLTWDAWLRRRYGDGSPRS